MTKLGELLKSEREKRSLSLHEIGMSLKINPKILKAIEDGDQANFPAKTFLRGFVKSYAQYLRLDVNQALQMFQEEYGSAKIEPIPTQPSQQEQPVQPQGVPRYESSLKRPDDAALPVANNNRIYTILFAILLLTLIAFVAKMMDKYQKESRDAKTEVVETVESTTTTSLPAIAPVEGSESTTTTSMLTESGSTSTTMTPTTTSTIKAAAAVPVTTTTTTSTTLKAAPTTTTVKATTTSTTTSSTTSTTTTTMKGAMTEVIVEALNRVSIRFSLNGGQKWETLELNPDQVHTFRSRTTVQLEVTDGGAVNVIVNGRDRGVPGTIGKPLKLNFP